MKLLRLFPSIERGGAEEYALTIASAAVTQGWEVHAAFPHRDETTSLIRDFSGAGVRCHPLEIGETGSRSQQTKQRHLARMGYTLWALSRVKPDVILLVLPWIGYGFGSILACGLLNIRTAVVFQLVDGKLSFGERRLRVYQWARSRGQRWVTISENNRQLLASSFHVPLPEISVIYNGAEVNSVPSSAEERIAVRRRVRRELGLSEECRALLTVAALRPQKGHEYLTRTIPHILREFPNTRWVWAGEGELREKLVELVREYGVEDAVLFLGRREDVPDLLCAADLFVFPTRFEGQSFALAEAMAMGLPVVTTNASGIPEVVTHMEHGIVCRKEDSCDLLEATLYALHHPAEMQEMARNAQLRAREFSEEGMVEGVLAVLGGLWCQRGVQSASVDWYRRGD